MTSRRLLTIVVVLTLAASPVLVARQSSVDFDRAMDFSPFKTFALRGGTVASDRAELDNPLFVKILGRAIRAALVDRGLRDTAMRPDLLVDFRVTNEEVSTTQRGLGLGPQSVRYTQATLVIDIMRAGETTPIWRGVYRDDESTGAKLVQRLPADAKTLVGKFPKK